jgi:hypothetical protein
VIFPRLIFISCDSVGEKGRLLNGSSINLDEKNCENRKWEILKVDP